MADVYRENAPPEYLKRQHRTLPKFPKGLMESGPNCVVEKTPGKMLAEK
jgi:hypothetical protein